MGTDMSGRIRTIKPEWLEDELLALASSDARVLSIAVILRADDYGNGRANPVMMSGDVFPGKVPETLAKALEELARLRYLILYEVDGQHYYHIRTWDQHQKVDKPGKPRVPRFREELATLAKVPESLAKVPESLATDHDHDHDPDLYHDTTTTVQSQPRNGSKVPCPRDLKLLDDQIATMETSMIPRWAIDELTQRFVLKAMADPTDKRPLSAWRKCLTSAVHGDWGDSSKRPKKPQQQVSAQPEGWVSD
jgi:hypothetical protein